MTRPARFAAAIALACACATAHPHAGAMAHGHSTVLERFLARGEDPPVEYRALRRLEAQNAKFKQSAWMLAWTEYDHVKGFRYQA